MAHDVFISYSAKDKTTADAVCAMLESDGIRCWIAPRDVLASMEWGEAIIDAIEQCRIMVLVFTASANDSPQIHREIERAVNHGVAILPLRMEDVLPAKSLEYFISDVHWLDALTPPLEAHLRKLAGTIKIVLAGTEPDASPAPPPIERPPSPHRFWGTRAWKWAAGTVAALLLCAVFVVVHFTSHPASVASPQPASPPAPATPGPNAPGGTAPATPAASSVPAPAPTQGGSKTPKSAVNTPEATADNASSLEDTMRALQSELSNIGTVNFAVSGTDTTNGSPFQRRVSEQISNVVADPAQCRVSYHWAERHDDETSPDSDVGVLLRNVTGIVVEAMTQKLTEVNDLAGHANWVIASTTPPVTALVVRSSSGEGVFPFTDPALAHRAAATFTQAVKLCVGTLAN